MGTIVGNLLRKGGALVKGVLSTNPITGAAVGLAETLFKKRDSANTTQPFTTAPINPSTPVNETVISSSFPFQAPPKEPLKIGGGIYIGNERGWFERYGTIAISVFFGVALIGVLIFKKK